jgi:hypothetical protein
VLAVLATAGPRLRGSTAAPAIALLVDRSASTRGEALDRARELAPELAEALDREHGSLHLIGFGRGAQLLAAPEESLEAIPTAAVQEDSQLAAALRLAAAQLPNSARGEIVLVSDGLYTGDDPRSMVPELRRRGIRVHYVPVGARGIDDVAITRIAAPQRVPLGQRFSVVLEVDSPRARPARLRLHDAAGRLLADQSLELAAGRRRYAVALVAESAGAQTFVADIASEGDSRPGNNQARAVLDVVARPRLVVYNAARAQSALVRSLASAELDVELRDASTPLTLASLHGVLAVALENIPLSALGDQADEALDTYVRELGGGLLITGGRSSYAAGGYYRSRVEALLPVAMDRREELRRPRIDLGVALDRSGSMAMAADNGVLKMDLANRATVEAIKLLAPGDGLTVLAVDTTAHVMVPLQRLSDAEQLRGIVEKVLRVEPGGGGISVGTALAVTMHELLASDAASRHILLFADAADAEEPGNYRELVDRWTRAGGSLSVVGLGTPDDRDAALLREIADLGGGTAYFTADALQLPRVFAQDVMHVARKTFLEQRTPVAPGRGMRSLSVDGSAIPDVGGYNLTYLGDGAEAMLVSEDDQHAPLAAGRHAGAGKVFAVTFEADGVFTGPLADWSQYKTFLRSALEWIKRPEAPEGLAADIQLVGDRALVKLEVASGRPLTAAPEVVLRAPGAVSAERARLEWTSPTTLEASLPVDGSGVFQGAVQIAGGTPIELAPVVLPYSPELAVQVAADGSDGVSVLEQLARATGGGPLQRVEGIFRRTDEHAEGERDLAPWLAGALLALLLVDIAHRRGLLDTWLARVKRFVPRVQRRRSAVVSDPTLDRQEPPELPTPSAANDQVDDALSIAKKRAQQRRR